MVATLTALPAAPDPNSPGTFNTLAYPFTVAQRDMVTELNAFIATLNSTYWPATPVTAMIDGTAAAPAYSWASDTNLGIYRAGADRLAVAANGALVAEFNASGAILTGLLSGTAVIQSATDVTAGRLLTTGAGPDQAFKRTNILGTVAQSGGVPTGALIENGTSANGRWIRWADGTQWCMSGILETTVAANNYAELTWTYPAAFIATPEGVPSWRTAGTPANIAAAMAAGSNGTITTGATSAAVILRNGTAGSLTMRSNVLAIGRWF